MDNKAIPATVKYPDRPITFIVPFGVGGGMDLVARLLEKTSATHLGQPLVIVNKPGGAGTSGWNELSAANPDGYTIGLTTPELLLHPLYDSTKFNYPTALEPLVQISDTPMVMIVMSDQPWNSIADLVEYAKQHPGKLKFGHGGIGSISHISGETFAKSANITLNQVPFQGSAESIANLLGKHIQITFISPALLKENIQSGKIKALAVVGNQRLSDPLLKDIPTFKEQGFDVAFSNWFVIAAPKELPVEVKNKLIAGFAKMINDPEFKTAMDKLGLEVAYLDSKDSQEKWINEKQKLSQTVQDTGILNLIKSQKK